MLQRIQTIFLLLAAVCVAVFVFTVPVNLTIGKEAFQIAALECGKCGSTTPSFLLLGLSILIFVMTFITIFKFKNLRLQKTLCSVCLLLTIALAASVLVLALTAEATQLCFGFGLYLLAAPMIFYLLARGGVSHDQKLIRDSESFR